MKFDPNPTNPTIRMRPDTFRVFDQLHRAKNLEVGSRLSRAQMLDIVVSSAAAVLGTGATQGQPPQEPKAPDRAA